jgi:transposase-like protein
MRKNRRYTPEFRAKAVKLVLEHGVSQEGAAKCLEMPRGTLGSWTAAAKGIKGVTAPGMVGGADTGTEIDRLRKSLAKVRLEREILAHATAYFAREAPRYDFIKKWRHHYSVKDLTRVLEVSRAGFYAWVARLPSPRKEKSPMHDHSDS